MDAMFCFKQAMEVLQAIENELEVTSYKYEWEKLTSSTQWILSSLAE